MKKISSFLALLLFASALAHAQDTSTAIVLDSILVSAFTSDPGYNFGSDLQDYPGNHLDATADGIADIVTVVEQDNKRFMKIGTLNPDTIWFTIDLTNIRQRLVSSSAFTPDEASDLQFEGFYPLLTKTDSNPGGVGVLFTASDAPVIFDPSNNNVVAGSPQIYKFLNASDWLWLKGDVELVLKNKAENVVQIMSSRFASDN